MHRQADVDSEAATPLAKGDQGKASPKMLKVEGNAAEKDMNIFETGALGAMGGTILILGVFVLGVMGSGPDRVAEALR
ncbi:unnamed protein product [Symbiodinium pilosum]|uniref:Uncharacterized protein n=1 Tax=Symbiodinium pilosum TaxID=2952 RepID=A0A812YBU0_SYMPI|nr:unnamed protein product [Symbiodinium pilosum]